MIKAQVHSGGRGKAGGIRLAKSPEEAERLAGQILGMDIHDRRSSGWISAATHQVLVALGVAIAREYYLGAILDRDQRGVTLMGSAEGGVEIEEVAREAPEIIKVEADPLLGLQDYEARELAFGLGLEATQVNDFVAIVKGLYRAFVGEDGSLAEINPLIQTDDGRWLALDSKMVLDDSALARHPGVENLRDPDEENATEMEARAAGLAFVKLDGDIGCMVNSAGLSMATMDAIKNAGGAPANFLDVGGGATAAQVLGLRLILTDPHVKAILFNIFGGIARRRDRAGHRRRPRPDRRHGAASWSLRLLGTNQEEGAHPAGIRASNLITAETLDEAAEKVVAASRGAAVS